MLRPRNNTANALPAERKRSLDAPRRAHVCLSVGSAKNHSKSITPHVWQGRKCIQVELIFTHSSHSSVFGCFNVLIALMCPQMFWVEL